MSIYSWISSRRSDFPSLEYSRLFGPEHLKSLFIKLQHDIMASTKGSLLVMAMLCSSFTASLPQIPSSSWPVGTPPYARPAAQQNSVSRDRQALPQSNTYRAPAPNPQSNAASRDSLARQSVPQSNGYQRPVSNLQPNSASMNYLQAGTSKNLQLVDSRVTSNQVSNPQRASTRAGFLPAPISNIVPDWIENWLQNTFQGRKPAPGPVTQYATSSSASAATPRECVLPQLSS